jgi:hypothetical protein
MKKGTVSYGILTPLISNQEIGRGSKYHGKGCKNIMDRGVKYHG